MSAPLEWLADALALVGVDGRLQPQNAAMRALLAAARLDGAIDLAQLPLDRAARAALQQGHDARCEVAGAVWRLRLVEHPGERWLVASPLHGELPAATMARARLLGDLAGSVVHDLANRVGAVVGYADHLEPLLPPIERERLQTLVGSARDALLLLRSLAQCLDRSPRADAPVALAAIASEAVALLQKHALRLGRSLRLSPCAVPLFVRGTAGNLLPCVASAAVWLLRSGSGELTVELVHASDGPRARAALRLCDRGDADLVRRLAGALGGDAATMALGFQSLPGGSDLLQTAFALRRAGGDLRAGVDADGARWLELSWPAIASPTP